MNGGSLAHNGENYKSLRTVDRRNIACLSVDLIKKRFRNAAYCCVDV